MIHPKEARFDRDGFEILPDRLPYTLIEELTVEINAFVAHYDIEGEQQVLRKDHHNRGNIDTFLQSATRVHGFLEAEAIDEYGILKVPRDYALNKLGHALHDHLPAFRKLAQSTITRSAFSRAGFGQSQIDQSMVIFKPPHIGGHVHWSP